MGKEIDRQKSSMKMQIVFDWIVNTNGTLRDDKIGDR